MFKSIKIPLLFLAVIVLGFIFLSGAQIPDLEEELISEKTFNYVGEREGFEVFDEEGEIVLEYKIDDFNEWMIENWDIFEIIPQVGGRDIEPGSFRWFDKSASISPDFKKLAFSVHDYAVASYTSFVGIIEIETGELSLIKEHNNGSIGDLIWSPTSSHVAYTLSTGRAGGDYFSVDNVKTLQKEFTLSEEDILEKFEEDADFLMPEFRELNWSEQGERIEFVTNAPEERTVRWSIENSGEDLHKEEVKEISFSQIGNLMINIPGIEEGEWYLSYEKEGSPALKKRINFNKEEISCFAREDTCYKFLAKDDSLRGARVEILGKEKKDEVNLLEIKFLEY